MRKKNLEINNKKSEKMQRKIKTYFFLTILIIFNSNFIYCQSTRKKITRVFQTDSLKVSVDNFRVEKRKAMSLDSSLRYYCIFNSRLLYTEYSSSDQLISGDFTFLYPNGSMHCKGTVKRGLRVGEWIYWERSGFLEKTETYNNGKLLINDKRKADRKIRSRSKDRKPNKNNKDAQHEERVGKE